MKVGDKVAVKSSSWVGCTGEVLMTKEIRDKKAPVRSSHGVRIVPKKITCLVKLDGRGKKLWFSSADLQLRESESVEKTG
jgi:hypothetical protein